MERLKCHHHLNLPVSHFIKNIDSIPSLPENNDFFATGFNPKLFLHEHIYTKLSDLGTLHSLVFEMKPLVDKKSIHIDINSKTLEPYWPSLNIVIDGQGVMRWFNPTGDGIVLKNKGANVHYRAWFNKYGDVIDQWDEGKVALVRTDIPHQVWNFDNVNRRIVSIRWSNKKSWEETIKWFKDNFQTS
jgi:hypothetical protein